jgi:hypothetical protein
MNRYVRIEYATWFPTRDTVDTLLNHSVFIKFNSFHEQYHVGFLRRLYNTEFYKK